MANRAYLFPSEAERFGDSLHPSDSYFDSRWGIPLAWFFFYNVGDLRWVERSFEGSTWRELKLSADRDTGFKTFCGRRPLLNSLIESQIDPTMIDEFLGKLNEWSGTYLLMDPQEILMGSMYEEEWHCQQITRILRELTENARPEMIAKDSENYVGQLDPDPDRRVGQIIGYTYW